jgi:hypothetical protein
MINAILYESCAIYYLYISGKTHPITIPTCIEQWLAIFEEYKFDVLWVMAGNDFSRTISWRDFDKIDRDRCKVFPDKPTDSDSKPSFISIERKSQKKGEYHRERFFAFVEHGRWTSNNKNSWILPGPYALDKTLEYLNKEFNLDILWSPGYQGQKILDRIWTRKNIKVDNLKMTDRINEMISFASVKPVWKRFEGLSKEQVGMKYLHSYDKNSQHTGAAQSCYFGIGQPNEVGPESFNLQLPGFWKYRILDVGDSEFDGYSLPCPLEINRCWASSDLLLAARTFKIEFEILGGLVWAKGSKLLEEWAREMRQYRVNFRDNRDKYPIDFARENAEGTAKEAANALMGRLKRTRPDYHLGIIHRSIVNQMYSFNRINRDYGIKPVLVSTDSFWIVSDEEDPAKAIPGILGFQHEQRGYKHLATVEMSDKIIGIFRTARPDVINTYLKKESACVESI